MSYEPQDRARTAPIRERLRDYMEGRGWLDMDRVAEKLGARVGTLLSKGREFNDYHHASEGLAFESRRVQGGRWEYRLVKVQTGQLELMEVMA